MERTVTIPLSDTEDAWLDTTRGRMGFSDLGPAVRVLLLEQRKREDELWDLDFRAAVQGVESSNFTGEYQDVMTCEEVVAHGAEIADEMARVRAERRKEAKR